MILIYVPLGHQCRIADSNRVCDSDLCAKAECHEIVEIVHGDKHCVKKGRNNNHMVVDCEHCSVYKWSVNELALSISHSVPC